MWCSTRSTVRSYARAEHAHLFTQLGHFVVGQPARRLVEDEELRSRRERASDLDALQRAEGQPGGRTKRVGGQIEFFEQLVALVAQPALLRPAAQAQRRADEADARARMGADHDVFEDT